MGETVSPRRAAAITGARNWDAVRAEFPEPVDAMADGLMVGDALADAVIAEMFDGGWSWSQICAAVDEPEQVRDAPPALTALLEQVTSPPSWFDAALAQAGAEAWWRFGSLQSSTLYQSLIYGYQARGFIRPLVATGRLTEGTWDRVVATARWVTLATAPAMMSPGSPGWVETVRIRLVHAMIRHHLLASGEWDEDVWGVPINQTYSQFTIAAGFLVLPVRIAKDFGIHYSRADLEAITHLWRWIGWVIGVEESRLPKSFADARQTDRIAHNFRIIPEAESKTLVKALLDDGYRTDLGLPGPLNDVVHAVSRPFLRTLFASVSTRWVDDEVAAAMGLRATPLHRLVDLARPVVRSREFVRWTGLLGSEHTVAQRELRLVTSRLGIDLADVDVARRYATADTGHRTPGDGCVSATFTLRQHLSCSPELAWFLLTDPEQMCRWSTAPVRIASPGAQDRPDTTGALRVVTLPGDRVRLREVVEHAEFPTTFRYRVYDGGPLLVSHRGEQTLTEVPGGVELCWRVEMALFPGALSHVMAWHIRREVRRSLSALAALVTEATLAEDLSPLPAVPAPSADTEELLTAATRVGVLQRDIADELAVADDPKQWFARVYQYVTEAMIDAATGRLDLGLDRPEWVLGLIPVFHEYYARNLRAYREGGDVEDAWAHAWSTCERVDPRRPHEPVVRGLLAGVSAHIDADLPRALADLHLDRYRDHDLREFRPDYLRLAPVFTLASDRLLADLPPSHIPWWTPIAGRVSPQMRDALLARTGYDVARHRVMAFERAVALTRASREPENGVA